jgi:hypothetical protein
MKPKTPQALTSDSARNSYMADCFKAQPKTLKAAPSRLREFLNASNADPDSIVLAHPASEMGLRKGQVYFCNASAGRFVETYYDEPLTNYLVGWRDPNNIEDSLNMVAPAVPVNRRFSYKAAENVEEFLSEVSDDQRSIGADFKRVVYTGEEVHSATINRGLMIIVDLDDVPDADKEVQDTTGVPPWQQQKVAKLTRRLYRNSFRRAISAIQAAAIPIALTWDKTAGVNPDVDIMTGLITATNTSGIRPNRVVYGDTSFLYRQQSYGAQNNPAGYLGYNSNVEASLAAALQVEKVKVCRERYQSSATAKSEILGANVYALFAQDDVDTEDPSNIKRFISQFSKDQGGGYFRVYVQQLASKLVAITVEFYELTVITYTGGIIQFPITGPQ